MRIGASLDVEPRRRQGQGLERRRRRLGEHQGVAGRERLWPEAGPGVRRARTERRREIERSADRDIAPGP